MTQPAYPWQPASRPHCPESEAFSANFNDAIMISFMHERAVLSEVVLIKVSWYFKMPVKVLRPGARMP